MNANTQRIKPNAENEKSAACGAILASIHSPADLRGLDDDQLKQLAGELRDLELATVAQNGGHLASNLGVVELTLALHLAFDAPRDKIIWDVGHQCYAHKILTGRREAFATLRQTDGLSGFPKREESAYDCFNTGHSSTSISAALGFAKARDLQHGDYAVVAVIGDGALTGGMAMEALNHAGDLQIPLIVILNDNEMSIAPNVGALSKYLMRKRTEPGYNRFKAGIKYVLHKIPLVGDPLLRLFRGIRDSLKFMLVDGMFFEELGFVYLGPIDGHDIPAMRRMFAGAKALKKPVVVHVRTQKGRGYAPAEQNPDIFHGVGPFDLAQGRPKSKGGPPTYTEIFSQTMLELGRQDARLVALTAAMPDGTGLDAFAKAFPQRFFDVGIAEPHAVTFAAGMAAAGLHPVVAVYSSFLQRAYDQILHDVCLPQLPVLFAVDRAGLVGEDGPTHQGIFDLSYLSTMPHMTILAPKDEGELRDMLFAAHAHPGPVALRYPRGRGQGVVLAKEAQPIPWGKAEQLCAGQDVAIFACGSMVYPALTAAEQLRTEGVQAAVLNARFIKPLDAETMLALGRQAGRVLTVEENSKSGGFGSACQTLFALEAVKVENLALPDKFVEQGKRAEILAKYGLDAAGIAAKVREMLQ